MNKLPEEIRHDIFNQIPQYTLLECARVCCQWEQFVQTLIYHDVTLDTMETFDLFMDTIRSNPLRGSLVRNFSLYLLPQMHFDKRWVCHLFLNLQDVEFVHYDLHEYNKNIDKINKSIDSTLEPTIKNVFEHGNCDFTLYLIESGLCTRLEKLVVLFDHMSEHQDILHRLRDMPVLNDLSIEYKKYSLTMNDVESMHQNITSLIEFTFRGAFLLKMTTPIISPKPIFSTKTIKWNFDNIVFLDTYIECLQYITKKYPNLEKIKFKPLSCINGDDPGDKDIFFDGWLPLIQSLGPRLVQIKQLEVSQSVDIFKLLDDSSCKLNKLSAHFNYRNAFFEQFSQSNQRNYIQKLSIDNVALYKPSDTLKDTRLVNLEINFSDIDNQPLLLNQFLKILPNTLRILILNCLHLDYDESDNCQFPSIISLTASQCGSVESEDRVRNSIPHCCPNIAHFCLR